MRPNLLRVVLSIALATSSAFAQSQSTPPPSAVPSTAKAPIPDFSGTWVLAHAEAGRGQGGAMGLGQEFTVTQDAKTITAVNSGARGGEVKRAYALDGSATQNGSVSSTANWDGAKLTIAVTGGPMRSQIWSLDSTGRLTIVSDISPGGGRGMQTTVVYQRK